ncbi:SGNH/GDSL hydrolase family protein [Paenibacillus dendritiformis]|uniref:SGNH/GDSL hydrolase family protein n=2 Tax=Paenibacillus dendritiformis TaxID=130049 RepID=UPI00143D1642|nr:SGNH/GDSL hydrolase family protein [Paenibacillus dendritiformis]NKI20924.1 SGNH/GDSL hydrolase family protein [Paenibacillus dendritiformis]
MIQINGGGEINGIFINSPEKINEYKHDYIVIASQYYTQIYNQLISLNVSKEKIFMYIPFKDLYNDLLIQKYSEFKDRNNHINGLITGISYTHYGIKENSLKGTFVNMALPSQDLYYDYQLAKKLISESSSIQYCIIGLCYYSFQYDMSKAAHVQNKVLMYYNLLNNMHNCTNIDDYKEKYNTSLKIGHNILKKNDEGRFIFYCPENQLIHMENKEELGQQFAITDSNKDYPETVKENEEVFAKYLTYLIERKIKPIVVVPPVSRYYAKHFSNKIKKQYESIIKRNKSLYGFQYFDYFASSIFDDSDFRDISHLNDKGAEKFTEILNQNICW